MIDMRLLPLLLACAMPLSELPSPAADSTAVAIKASKDAVEVQLPLTSVTGKVRAKRRSPDGFGQPLAPTKVRLDKDCYLEWQIGYDTTDKHAPFVASGVVFQRKGETKFGYELSTILLEAKKLGLVDSESLRALKADLSSQSFTMEENDRIAVEAAPLHSEKLSHGFQRLVEQAPVYVEKMESGSIEIQLKHKQRAVGYQAMLYVCLPMDKVFGLDGKLRPPGPARTKEKVLFRFDKNSVQFLLEIVRGFGLASRQHAEDLEKILDCILAQ